MRWIKQKWDKFMNPSPKGTTTFHGDMNKYRKAVNANMPVPPKKNESVFTDEKGNKVVIEGKLGLDVTANGIQGHITCLQAENNRLNNELDTARSALKNSIRERREESDNKDKRIRDLENEIMAMRTINKEESDYDCEMKGFNL